MMTYEFDRENDPTFQDPAAEIIYFEGLKDIAWKFYEVVQIRNAFERFNHGEKITSGVFVVDSDLSYGMARMVITVFDKVFDHFTIERGD